MTADPRIYWVRMLQPGRLAVVARPRGAAHVAALKAAGVDVLVSLLEPAEAAHAGLGDEVGLCARAGVAFLSLPVVDHGVPGTFEMVEEAIVAISDHLRAGRGVGAHCYAGLGRSPLFVASVLIHHGHDDAAAIDLVSTARGCPVPEMAEQHRWLEMFAARRRQRT